MLPFVTKMYVTYFEKHISINFTGSVTYIFSWSICLNKFESIDFKQFMIIFFELNDGPHTYT